MKFLILVKNNPGGPALEEPLTVLKDAHAYLKASLEEGVFDCIYQFANGREAVAIANANSAEKLWERLTGYPLYSVQTFEVHPLVDLDHVFATNLARLQQ